MRKGAAAVAVTFAGAGVVLLLVAAAAWPKQTPEFRVIARPQHADVVPPITAGRGHVPVRSAAVGAQPVRATPVSIAVPSLEIAMPIVAEGLNGGGGLDLPDTSAIAAWYRHGGRPGDDTEATLVAAHVDNATTGVGPFARLANVSAAATVTVSMSDGTSVQYSVVAREQFTKRGLDFAGLLADSPGMLVLVTCGGRFDATTGHYEDNIVVWAVPSDSSWGAQ